MDTYSFVLKVNTKDIIKDSKNLEVFFDFSSLSENHEFFSNKNEEKHWKILNRNSEKNLDGWIYLFRK